MSAKSRSQNPEVRASSAQVKASTASTTASARPASARHATPSTTTGIIEQDLKTAITTVLADPRPEHLVGKCVFIIDENTRAAAFFRHRDVVYINTYEKTDLEPERIRVGVLGALRIGKPLVIDLMDNTESLNMIREAFKQVDEKLYDQLIDLSILKEENYSRLFRDTDPDDVKKTFMYVDERLKAFQLIFVFTGNKSTDEMLKLGVTYKIV